MKDNFTIISLANCYNILEVIKIERLQNMMPDVLSFKNYNSLLFRFIYKQYKAADLPLLQNK